MSKHDEWRERMGWAKVIPKKPFRATEKQRAEIRKAHAEGAHIGALRRKYDATSQTIRKIVYGDQDGRFLWRAIKNRNKNR